MKKIFAVMILIIIILSGIIAYLLIPKNTYKSREQAFYSAISAIEIENYQEAYNLSKSINSSEDSELISGIIEIKWSKELNTYSDKLLKFAKDLNEITSSSYIDLSIYGKTKISNENIEKINNDCKDLEDFDNFKEKFPKEILNSRTYELYDAMENSIELAKTLSTDISGKLNDDEGRKKFSNESEQNAKSAEELSNKFKEYKTPDLTIPDIYKAMLELN